MKKLFCRRLYKFDDFIKVFPNTQVGFRKGLVTTDALLLLTHNLQSSLEERAESRTFSLDFCSAFDLVNHQDLLYKLKSMGVGVTVFNIFKNY